MCSWHGRAPSLLRRPALCRCCLHRLLPSHSSHLPTFALPPPRCASADFPTSSHSSYLKPPHQSRDTREAECQLGGAPEKWRRYDASTYSRVSLRYCTVSYEDIRSRPSTYTVSRVACALISKGALASFQLAMAAVPASADSAQAGVLPDATRRPLSVFVTGATGFLGGALTDALLSSPLVCRVGALVRDARSPRAAALSSRGVALVTGTLRGAAEWAPVVATYDVFIHTAIDLAGGVEASEWALLQALAAATGRDGSSASGSRQPIHGPLVVYTSGSWAYGDTRGEGFVWREEHEDAGHSRPHPWETWRRGVEGYVMSVLGGVVLRPSVVFGSIAGGLGLSPVKAWVEAGAALAAAGAGAKGAGEDAREPSSSHAPPLLYASDGIQLTRAASACGNPVFEAAVPCTTASARTPACELPLCSAATPLLSSPKAGMAHCVCSGDACAHAWGMLHISDFCSAVSSLLAAQARRREGGGEGSTTSPPLPRRLNLVGFNGCLAGMVAETLRSTSGGASVTLRVVRAPPAAFAPADTGAPGGDGVDAGAGAISTPPQPPLLCFADILGADSRLDASVAQRVLGWAPSVTSFVL